MIDNDELIPGETVVWEGEPAFGWWLAREDLPLIAGVPAASLAVALVVWLSPSERLPGPFKVFLWVGVAIVLLYHLSYASRRQVRLQRTRYAVTTHRIIIEEGLLKSRRLYELWRIGRPHLRPGRQGTGSIAMGGFPNPLAESIRQRYVHLLGPQGWPPAVLWNVPDAQRVCGLIDTYWRESMSRHRGQAPPGIL